MAAGAPGPSTSTGTVNIRTAVAVAAFAARYGVAPGEILATAGIDPAAAADPDARISHSQLVRAWSEAASRSADGDFGLHMAEWLRPEDHFDVVGYLCRSSPTLGVSLRRLARYFGILHQRVSFRVEERGDAAHVIHELYEDAGPAPRHPVEFVLATLVLQGRRSISRELVPHLVRFRHEAPPSTAEHRRIFAAPVRFSAEHSEVVLSRELLDEPQREADPRLWAVLERQAEAELQRLPPPGGLTERARGAVLRLLREGAGEPSLEDVAARLHTSPRSLQRHLSQGGTSFRGLVDELRRDLALRHLSERQLALSEIAFLLGFSEVSAFHRAFRRWTGQTPAAYRAR